MHNIPGTSHNAPGETTHTMMNSMIPARSQHHRYPAVAVVVARYINAKRRLHLNCHLVIYKGRCWSA